MPEVKEKVQQPEVVELRCDQAQPLLRTIGIGSGLDSDKLTPEQYAACRHYANCRVCRVEIGISAIVGETLECAEALAVWAGVNDMGLLKAFTEGHASTLCEQVALEHIFGRRFLDDSVHNYNSLHVGNRVAYCECDSCRATFKFVEIDYLRSYHVRHGFLLELFYAHNWDMEPLLKSTRRLLVSISKNENVALLNLFDSSAYIAQWWAMHEVAQIDETVRTHIDSLEHRLLGNVSTMAVRMYCNQAKHGTCMPVDRDCGVECYFVQGLFVGLLRFIHARKAGKAPMTKCFPPEVGLVVE